MSTSSESWKRYSLGSRTAWLPPLLKSFARSAIARHLRPRVYTSRGYLRALSSGPLLSPRESAVAAATAISGLAEDGGRRERSIGGLRVQERVAAEGGQATARRHTDRLDSRPTGLEDAWQPSTSMPSAAGPRTAGAIRRNCWGARGPGWRR